MTSSCHADLQQHRFVHGPVALGRCLDCHGIVEGETTPYRAGDDHWFDDLGTEAELCYQCHQSMATEAVVHYPVRRGKCLTCHDPHGSDNPGMLRHERIADNCYECHEQVMDDDPQVHAPVRVGACTVCHDPHGSPNRLQLVAAGSNLCLRCHTAIGETLASRRHVHAPVVENCVSCHSPHDSQWAPNLKEAVPALCLSCHTDMAGHIQNSAVQHGALATKRSCLNCHDPHAADFTSLLPDRPIVLCLECHDRAMVGSDRLLRDMKGFLADNPDHHGPVRTGDCQSCHDPHGSDVPALLARNYPRHFYASFDLKEYGLCFGCHEQSLVMEAETTTLTGFRQGSKNLHYVHVHREPKGRTCRACHDVHASKHPKHIADSVPFGRWSMPIHFEELPDGGTCSPGCHGTRTYRRDGELPTGVTG